MQLKSGDYESSSESDSVLSSDSEFSSVRAKNLKNQKNYHRFDLNKDKNTKFSIKLDFQGEVRLKQAPYPLNIIDRSYLVTAVRYHTQEKVPQS